MTVPITPWQEELSQLLRQWQGIERQSMIHAAEIIERTTHPLVRIIMEVIRQDSMMHHRVQQYLRDHLDDPHAAPSPGELADVMAQLEAHDVVEKQAIETASLLRDRVGSPVHRLLLDYLVVEETKHDRLLHDLKQLRDVEEQAGDPRPL